MALRAWPWKMWAHMPGTFRRPRHAARTAHQGAHRNPFGRDDTSIKPPRFSDERGIPENLGTMCDLKLPLSKWLAVDFALLLKASQGPAINDAED
jgi:hypothetical protein